ncbi:MAG: hypothetical protein MJ090_06190 [Clostridia bacterium]|nr:hypothetical protein [Clostridia bacterium]
MEKILFIGGDNRSKIAMENLKAEGYFVSSFGLFNNDFEIISDFDVIVLPVPATKDGETVYCPLSRRKIYLCEVEKKAKGKLIISCKYIFENENCIDLMKSESFAYLNCVPTAEGAIAFAIQNTDFTVWKSKVLVIGNGRVAKVLISRLASFGCDLTVSARNDKDFSLLEAQNINFVHTSAVNRISENFDIIFNTVDADIFDNSNLPRKPIIIDLSSKGCLDFDIATEQKIKAYKLPSIPAKTAPLTAGNILAKTIKTQIKANKCNN